MTPHYFQKGSTLGIWFKQLFVEGLVVGGLIALAVALPWTSLKFAFLVALIWVIFFIQRDPRAFYRRMFRAVFTALLLLPAVSLAVDAAGYADSELWGGIVKITAGIGQGTPSWVLLTVAALCIGADLLQHFFEINKSPPTISIATPDPNKMNFRMGGANEIMFQSGLTISNPYLPSDVNKREIAVVGATLSIKIIPPLVLNCRLFLKKSPGPDVLVSATTPLRVAPQGKLPIMAEAEVSDGFKWLVVFWRAKLLHFLPISGELQMITDFAPQLSPVEVCFSKG